MEMASKKNGFFFSTITMISLSGVLLAGCNSKMQFGQVDLSSKQSTTPVAGQYVTGSGTCASDGSTKVLSCLSCAVPTVTTTTSQLSLKAQQLLAAMTNACAIPNNSYPAGYVAPTRAQLLAKINRCSPTLYPDTVPSATQSTLINNLVSADATTMQTMWSGLWYQPPFSTDFETYFGLQTDQAAYLFCMGSVQNVAGTMYPAGYNAGTAGFNYQMPADYVVANTIRQNLENCIDDSILDPNTNPDGSSTTALTCTYNTLQGPSGDTMINQAASWLSSGATVGADIPDPGLCETVSSINQLTGIEGLYTIGMYSCQ